MGEGKRVKGEGADPMPLHPLPFSLHSLDDQYAAQIVHVEEQLPRPAIYGELATPLHPILQAQLKQKGIEQFYLHQTEAYNAAMQGEDLVVVTGTNSGKSLCYNLPALHWALTEPACRALYLFPTKALAQDQLGKIEDLLPSSQIRAGTYDGDTPKSRRSSLRQMSHLILTNPDMLHIGILPSHEQWVRFLKSLKLIVIDEMHTYRGVFGSHVGGVVRRLLRLCEWHHSRPQIIACSATIGNPSELFTKLTGREARIIEDDGSPKGKRTFVFWNPPYLAPNQKMSANLVTSELMVSLSDLGLRTLAFSRSRVGAELVLKYARQKNSQTPPSEENSVIKEKAFESYRAGYTAKERRKIEQDLFKGRLMGLSATNAMELGVDVGGLDAVILNGYPGSISSFWQQAGRAGRGTRDALAIYIAHEDPLEQFLIRKPALLMAAQAENVTINPTNPQILTQQLRCAAHERPLAPSEIQNFGGGALDVAESLDRAGELSFQNGLFYYPSFDAPASKVNIRGAGGDSITLLMDGQELGSMEGWRALTSAYEGAVYLHRGVSHTVQELDLTAKKAYLKQQDVNYYTMAQMQSVIESKVTVRDARVGEGLKALAGITVTDSVLKYSQISLETGTVMGTFPLDLPPTTYDTIALRLDLPYFSEEDDLEAAVPGVHGVEHALMAVAPLIASCDRNDLGSAWYLTYPDTLQPAIFIFDRTPGGIGFSEKLYESYSGLAQGALQLLTTCSCENGCPSCLLSARCEVANEQLSKAAAIRLLNRLI